MCLLLPCWDHLMVFETLATREFPSPLARFGPQVLDHFPVPTKNWIFWKIKENEADHVCSFNKNLYRSPHYIATSPFQGRSHFMKNVSSLVRVGWNLSMSTDWYDLLGHLESAKAKGVVFGQKTKFHPRAPMISQHKKDFFRYRKTLS